MEPQSSDGRNAVVKQPIHQNQRRRFSKRPTETQAQRTVKTQCVANVALTMCPFEQPRIGTNGNDAQPSCVGEGMVTSSEVLPETASFK